jgi:nucleolar pre-ribosomal-associated protein 2
LQIWELRKHHDSDDANFNDHCLVRVLPLLGFLESGDDIGSKRKRGETLPVSVRATARALEALVAKHTILPARTAFFRKIDPQARRLQRGLRQVSIEESLVSLRKAIQDELAQNLLEATPKVLDIALRSVSAPTPRHRVKERPWIVTIFVALRDCLDGQSEVVKNRFLVQLLRAIRINKATLPLETLEALVRDNIHGTELSGDGVDWELVAAVVELDSIVLATQASTNAVFDRITMEHETSNFNKSRTSKWRDQIILPTMRAFAQSRTLGSFVDCWYKQLLVLKRTNSVSVWDSIGDAFPAILEGSLPVNSILELIEQYATTVREASETKEKLNDTATSSKMRATLCVLEALLKGLQSDDLVSNIHPRLDGLLDSLSGLTELKGFKTTVAHDAHYWQLLTRVFQLWYPQWASRQAERKEVISTGVSLLSSKCFKLALAQCSSDDAGRELEDVVRTRNSAVTYIATLCHCFNQYVGEDGCSGLCDKALKTIAEQKISATLVFVEFPGLLASLQSELRKGLIRSLLQSARGKATDTQDSETQLKAIICAFQGISKVSILEEFVFVAVEELKTSPNGEDTFMTVIAGVDPMALEQTQRSLILDTLLDLPRTKQDQPGVSQLQRRLALILKLVCLPCQDSRLLTDASTLWKVVNLVEQEPSPRNVDALRSTSRDNIRLLEEITRRVVRTWLATQDREKSRELLVHMSKSIKDRVKSAKKAGKLSAGGADLAVMRTAVEVIESDARDAAKKLMVHREAKTARTYIDMLIASVDTIASSLEPRAGTLREHGADCSALLEALVDLPDSLLTAAGIEHSVHAKQVTQAASKIWEHSQGITGEDQSALAAMSFRLACKYGQVPSIGKDLLRGDASAREQSAVISAYEDGFKKANDEWKQGEIAGLQEIKSPSTLLLQQAAIRALTKEDFDSASSMSATTFLHCNLQAATQAHDFLSRRTALQSLAVVFKEKAFMTNQFAIEQGLSALQGILKNCPYAGALYLDITQVLTALFAHHRSRLQGRFHLVISLLQSLLTHLFHASKTSPTELSIRQARALARLLESFSNPPPLRHHRGKTSELVDEARKAQAHAGQFTQYLLHHYCTQVLAGSLGEGVREALLPGLWSVIEAMEVYSQDAIKSLSAAVNNSERAVLRSIYEDWKRFGKWEGL